jgi:hypothetical protein
LNMHLQSFGFVVFEGRDKILDWGTKRSRHNGKPVKIPMKQKLAGLFGEFEPALVILQAPKTGRAGTSAKTVLKLARHLGIPVRLISRAAIQNAFRGHNRNKYDVATIVATRFPELAARLPAKRKSWESEVPRMSIFDAAALGVTHLDGRT